MLFAAGARAQSSTCEKFKDTLASRVDPSIRGFTLEAVPSGTPTPPGAKVFGTCDGGAYKILFRRGGDTRPSPGGASDAAAQADAAPAPALQAAVKPPAAAPAPVTATVSAPAPKPLAAPVPAPAPPTPIVVQAPSPAPVTKKPVTVLAPATKEAAATPSHTEAAVAAVEPLPAPGDDGGDAKASLLQQALDFIARYWLWICVLLALPIAGWLWAWYAHRNAYDEAGLPRGPKL